MQPLSHTDQGHIKFKVVRSVPDREGQWHDEYRNVYLDEAIQIYIDHQLRVARPPSDPDTVFFKVKPLIDEDNNIDIVLRLDLDIAVVHNYILGQLPRIVKKNGLVPYPIYLEYSQLGEVTIVVRIGYGEMVLGTPHQRYVHNATHRSSQEIGDVLSQGAGDGIDVETVRRLKAIIRNHIQKHPASEDPHWSLVSTPFTDEEMFQDL